MNHRNKLIKGALLLTLMIALGNFGVEAVRAAILDSTKTFNPNNDAYVDIENPDTNYGISDIKLITDNYNTGKKYSYLKFDISPIPSEMLITSANLYLWSYATQGDGYTRIYAYSVENDDWNQTTITWNNRPDAVTLLSEYSGDTLAWWKWDVKAFVESEHGGDKTVSLALIPGDINNYTTEFRSKEYWNPEYRPYLEVTYVLSATIDINPDTLTLKNNQVQWVTAYIELPSGYSVNKIDLSTVRLIFGTEIMPAELNPYKIGDYDGDGIPDLMVKFKTRANQPLPNVGEYEAKVIGEVAGMPFQGSDTIRVIP